MRKPGWELYGRENGQWVYEGWFSPEEYDFDEVREHADQLFEESRRGRFPYDSVVVKDALDRRKVLYRAKREV